MANLVVCLMCSPLVIPPFLKRPQGAIATGATSIEYLMTQDDKKIYIEQTIDLLTDKLVEKQPGLLLAREALKEVISKYRQKNEK